MESQKIDYTEQITLPKTKGSYNVGLTTPSPEFMERLLGKPRLDGKFTYKKSFNKKGILVGYSAVATVLQNKELQNLMKTFSVGSIRATGLERSVKSLKDVMADVKEAYPALHDRIKTDGMLVPRYMSTKRNKKTGVLKVPSRLSNHSWGCAIDLRIDDVKDVQGDNLVLCGLELIAPIFNKHKWVWGGAYIHATEDGMHFEVSKEQLLHWAVHDEIGPRAKKAANSPGLRAVSTQKPTPGTINRETRAKQTISTRVNTNILKRGDKGPAVLLLQNKLNKARAKPALEPDSRFGRNTETAVKCFQRQNHLKVTGIVDRETQEALSRIRIQTPTLWDRLMSGLQRYWP